MTRFSATTGKRFRPSVTSLVAFFLIVTPLVYVLSYAPVVQVCGRTVEVETDHSSFIASWGVEAEIEIWSLQRPIADGSLYPTYKPADWLIDNTPLRGLLFGWAELWGVRKEFELGKSVRHDRFAIVTFEEFDRSLKEWSEGT